MTSGLKQRRRKNIPVERPSQISGREGKEIKSRPRVKISAKVKIVLFASLIAALYSPLGYCRKIWFGRPGRSIRGGLVGRWVDSRARIYALGVYLKRRKQQMLDLDVELPVSKQQFNRQGIVNLPQSTLEHLLVRSTLNKNAQQRAMAEAADWKEKLCQTRDTAIPDQLLQPNYGSWFRPLADRKDTTMLLFSEEDMYQLITQFFPTIAPLYKRTLDQDERVLIWSVCAMYQYGGYFVGNTTRTLDSELIKISIIKPSPCSDFGVSLLNEDSVILLSVSPRHPRLEMAVDQLARLTEPFSTSYFLSVITLLDSPNFHIQTESGASKQLPNENVKFSFSEVDNLPETVKTVKNPLFDQLLYSGCTTGWLCNRCLKMSFRGSYSTCKSFCYSCHEEIICDRKEADAMTKIILEVKREGPKRNTIPKIIHQTYYEDLSSGRFAHMVRLQNTWRSSGWDYRFYDDNDVRNYIINNFPSRVLDAFDAIIPGAFKADLFRYLVLMKDGGIYVDSDVVLNTNLDLFVTPQLSFFVPVDIVTDYANPGSFCAWNGLMGSAPGHPFVVKATEKTLTNILNRADAYDVERNVCLLSGKSSEVWKLRLLPILSITGPCLLGMAMNEVLKRDPLTNFQPGWVHDSDDSETIGHVLVLQANKSDMGAFRFTDIDRGIIMASTGMDGMSNADKDAFDAMSSRDAEVHYSRTEVGVDVFGSERVYIDKHVTRELVLFSLV
jgi:mannosyltransferase OCH1-like enzyme